MLLGDLASKLNLSVLGDPNVEIHAVTEDSRKAGSGLLFAALPGATVNGLDYLDKAIAAGVSAVMVPAGTVNLEKLNVPVLTSHDCKSSFAHAASLMTKALPSNRIAITGTNGKTSVAHFTREILSAAGMPTASAGTLGLMPEGLAQLPPLTTPDPVALFSAMETVAAKGYDNFVMEASSHGLEQRRLDGFDPQIAVFTNLSQDHLDYHVGMTAYGEAKFRLFRSLLSEDGVVVSNVDEEFASRLGSLSRKFITYGYKPSDLHILSVEPNDAGQLLKLNILGKAYDVQVEQIGAYQAHNLMAALGIALASGVDQDKAVALLQNLPGVPGRMEIAAHKDGKLVIVDYAHTPDALVAALKSARPHVQNKLRVVFGAGGDRDVTKRPLMGKAAAEFADVAYVTDDNPRSEEPALIRQAVMAGSNTLIDAGGRHQAIKVALEQAQDGDVVVIAGKGHETTQTIQGVQHPFDDRLVAAELAKDLW